MDNLLVTVIFGWSCLPLNSILSQAMSQIFTCHLVTPMSRTDMSICVQLGVARLESINQSRLFTTCSRSGTCRCMGAAKFGHG